MLTIIKIYGSVSIQDLGRSEYVNIGVPIGGAMDRSSFLHLNQVLHNQPHAAQLECFKHGPDFSVEKDGVMAFSSHFQHASINSKPIPVNQQVHVKMGDIIRCGPVNEGVWGYIGLRGGIDSSLVMGSRSYLEALGMTPIALGDSLMPESLSPAPPKDYLAEDQAIQQAPFVQSYIGPEFNLLSHFQRKALFAGHFSISSPLSRIGYRLKSSVPVSLQHQLSILSGPVFPGVIQLPPSGHPILLMRDAPTTGGYPRVLILDRYEINKVAQLKEDAIIKFSLKG